jgi:hypothetical protein
VSSLDIPVSVGDLLQGVPPIDDDSRLARFEKVRRKPSAAFFSTDIPLTTRGPPRSRVQAARK